MKSVLFANISPGQQRSISEVVSKLRLTISSRKTSNRLGGNMFTVIPIAAQEDLLRVSETRAIQTTLGFKGFDSN